MSERRTLTEREAFELLAHFVSTAELHATEGGFYTDKRILEGCLPLLDAMIRDDDDSDWLEEFRSDVDEATTARSANMSAYVEFLHSASGRIIQEMKRRQSEVID